MARTRSCKQKIIHIDRLPEDLVRKILSRLPIKDAVKTSVLSRKWRYTWTELPRLIFDDRFCEGLITKTNSKIISTIYQVLLLHRGPLHLFELSCNLESCPEIDHFVLVVLKSGVKYFFLRLPKSETYKLPSSIFSYGQQLKVLELRFCELKPPAGFNGFNKLVYLKLKEVSISGSTFLSLISNCPVLETLDLCSVVTKIPMEFNGFSKLKRLFLKEVDIRGSTISSLISNCPLLEYFFLVSYTNCGRLDIIAPNLKEFRFMGLCESICFTNTPKLATVLIATYDNDDIDEYGHQEIEKPSSSVICGRLPLVEELNVDHFYSKYMAANKTTMSLLNDLLCHLQKLYLLPMCFGVLDEVSSALCLVKYAKNLKLLSIEVHTGNKASVVKLKKLEGFLDVTLDHLREFELLEVSGWKCELQFIELILAKSPVMKKCRIKSKSVLVGKTGLRFSKELSRLQRASPYVEFVYENF